PWILEHLKRFQWSIYCEPFVGSGAVYFRLVSEGIFEQIRARGHHPRIVLNDADSRIVQLFRACRDYPEALAHAVEFTPYSREEHRIAQGKQESLDDVLDEVEAARRHLVDVWQSFKKEPGNSWGIDKHAIPGREQGGDTSATTVWHSLPSRILAASPHLQCPQPIDTADCLNSVGRKWLSCDTAVEVELARRYLVDGWQSFKNMPGDSWGVAKTHGFHPNGKEIIPREPLGTIEGWQTLPDRILNATDYLKRCYIENDDAIAVAERWATPYTCIYADPPYVGLEDYYAHNKTNGKTDSLDLHYRLAAALNTVESACVAVSYYPCDLVEELYPEEHWERHYKDTVASSAGITRQSKTRTRPKRQELLLIRKHRSDGPTVNLSGQLGLF
ncbi:MAG: DNA adenine methylase, partial [Prochlorotrichaceae cyanobacterium]